MNRKQKFPVIHTILLVGLSVSFAFILGLVISNFVVSNKIDEVEPFLKMFQDQSHFSNFKQLAASNIIKEIKEKQNILITSQTIAFILLFLVPVRIMLLLIGLYPPPIGSKFSFLRRIHHELDSVFWEAETGTSDGQQVKKSLTEPLDSSNIVIPM